MSEFDILREQRKLIQLMVGYVDDWLSENEERILALEKVFADTCVMDQLGFIHDKATGEIIAGSKLDWFNKMYRSVAGHDVEVDIKREVYKRIEMALKDHRG